MKKLFLLQIIALLMIITNSSKAINVSGAIAANTTWTSANSPYVVTSSITVNAGVTLTIQSGVTVQFNDGFGMTILGNLNATSTVFTSSSAAPTPGKWGIINIGNANNTGAVTLTSCQVSYAQYINVVKGSITTNATDFSNFQYYGITMNGLANNTSSANLTGGSFTNCGNCILINQYGSVTTNGTNMSNSTTGVYFYQTNTSSSSFTGGIISGMSTTGIYSNNPTSQSFSNVTINGNCARGLYLNNGNIAMTGCTITSCVTPIEYQSPSTLVLNGIANNFSGNTNKYVFMNHGSLSSSMTLPSINIPYYFPTTYYIYTGGRLQLSDDNILKFASAGIVVANGKLLANASIGKQIYFTSFHDDNLGGDANGNGSGTAPSMNQWSGINFQDASIDTANILRRVTIKYATNGVTIDNASPTIDSCVFSYNYHGIYATNASYPIINGCTIGSSGLTPIALTFDADPIFTGNIFSFQDNTYDAIGLIPSTLVANATLKIRKVTTSPNVTYVMLGDITVPVGKSLNINKGIVIKSVSNYKIIVLGALYANGTIDSNIVMTSVHDDNAGGPGDTNKNGTQTSANKGDFGGIVFAPGSLNASILNYCDIRFASMGQIYYSNQYQSGGSITTVNASPTISNCKISNCTNGIMCYQASNPTLTNNQIINSSSTPIAMSVSANPVFTNNTFTNAGYLGLGIIGETVTVNGFLMKRNLSGYTNITYVLLGHLTIASGTNVEVENGVVIKNVGYTISVDGGFKLSGTPSSRVILTAISDDNVGNPFDTNGDGNATIPYAGYAGNIYFNPSSDDAYSKIRCTTIKFGGYGTAVKWNNAAASMDDCIITNTSGLGLRFEGNSNPIIDSVQLQNGNSDPIGMSLTSDPNFSNITFTANATRGIQIIDNTLSSNALLRKRSMAGISNIAYFLNNLTIDPNATLTIEPGVVIKLDNTTYPYYYYNSLVINGSLVALGTSSQKIIFTSSKDDSNGGDYNNDGNNSSPDKNNWNGIVFNSSSISSSIKNCIFRYGGGSGVIAINSVNGLTIDSSLIEQSNAPAIYINGSSNPIIKNSQLLNINNLPVSMSMFSNPNFSNISLANVSTVGLGVIAETYSQSATIPIRNFAGYNNITYIGLGTFTINSGTTITIPAGIVFKGGNWIVNGRLNAIGGINNPIVFTSISDDNYGNPMDTKQDGSAQDPKNYPNNSSYFTFNDISNDSSMVKNTIFRYNYNSGILLYSASPTIDSCTFQTSVRGVFLSGVSQPILNNCTFNNLSYWQSGAWQTGFPILTSILSYPSSTLNNTISGNYTYKGIGILNETLSQDVTLTKRSFGGINNIPYIFDGFTIGSGATLTVAPGVVFKFRSGTLDVNKGLIAEGGSTPDSNIVFTSISDDFYGGDTNNDSNYTSSSNNWSGININNQALNNLCRFKNVIIKSAYYGLTLTSKSPTVLNTLFINNYEGVRATGASNPTINNCDFINNSTYGINNVDKSFTINAQNCWWNDNSGPTHASNPSGTGDKITDAVLYNPFRTIDAQNPMMGDVSLNGRVQAYDAALVLQKSVNAISLNAIQTRVADVSGTSGITAFDGSLILQYVVNKIQGFPAEELFKKAKTITPAFARLQIENKEILVGDTFTIPIQISKADLAQSIDLQIKYEPSLLNLLDLTAGSYAQNLSFNQNIDSINGMIYLSLASVDNLKTDGDFVYLTFIAKNTHSKQTNASLTINKFLANETDMLSEIVGGSILINNKATGISQIKNVYLDAAYPNPFSDVVNIPIVLSKSSSNVTLEIYSMFGSQVYTRTMDNLKTGGNIITWDGKNMDGLTLGNGAYVIYIKTADENVTQKLLLSK
jgi:parallel beta-helix repeat protein